jgi:hypothetical protein
MVFTLPDTFRDKELSATTQKIYKSKLNALSRDGFDTVAALLKNKLQVIRAIKALVPEDDAAARQKKRTFLSAIFWVLPEEVLPAKNAYHSYYQKVLPLTVVGTNAAWRPKKNA